MKKLSGSILISIFAFVGADFICDNVGAQEEIIWNGAKIGTDSIYYHSYWQDGSSTKFLPAQHNWVFVRFTPTCTPYTITGLPLVYMHYFSDSSDEPGTTAAWIDTVLPANLQIRRFFYEKQNGSPSVWDTGALPLTVSGDFWVGYCGSFPTGGGGIDTIFTARDATGPATPNRNFYSLTGCYGTLQPYSNYDFLITSVGQCVAGVEDELNSSLYFKPLENPVLKGKQIKFVYKIDRPATLKLYRVDGRLVGSKILNPGAGRIKWEIELPRGIYFYKVEPFSHGKIVVL